MLYYVQIKMRGVLEIPAHDWSVSMYKTEKSVQMTFEDFNQSCGMKLNVRDEWIVVANNIDWAAVEENYMAFFPSKRGRPAVSARMALGALIIQHKAKLSDRNLVKEVARNPYYQYFIGLESYQAKCPFGHGVLPELRKRFGMDFINKINEVVVKGAKPTPEHVDEKEEKPSANWNLGTMILDATCSPSNIRFPQDFSLLNEAREKLDGMIDKLHSMVEEPRRPRTYRKVLRKAYLAMAKAKRRPAKKMRSLVRVMLCAVKRNMDFVDAYLAKGLALEDDRDVWNLDTIRKLYAQQKEMFDEKEARGRGPNRRHRPAVRASDRAGEGENVGGVRREVRRERGRERACAAGEGVVRRIQRMHRAEGRRRALQGADGALPEACPCGPGVQDEGEQGVLRGTGHRDVRAEARQTARGRQEATQGRTGGEEERRRPHRGRALL